MSEQAKVAEEQVAEGGWVSLNDRWVSTLFVLAVGAMFIHIMQMYTSTREYRPEAVLSAVVLLAGLLHYQPSWLDKLRVAKWIR